jgi:DNA-binding response OmpR family regulator
MVPRVKILVVEDEAGIRFFLERLLTQDGYQVVPVESGEAALEHIAAEEFDLALIDLKLKGIGGMEVLAALRQQSPNTIAIVLTAYASLQTAVEALRQGAHDYLFKPCKTIELRESIRTGLLKRQQELWQRDLLSEVENTLTSSLRESPATATPSIPPEPTGEQMRFLQQGGLIVDFMRHVITLDGHLLELSPTEFNLLAYLVSEAPRVVSPQELTRGAQGYECEPWEARDTVRFHIYRIRRKVKEATGRTDVIRTVRGVGYTIVE